MVNTNNKNNTDSSWHKIWRKQQRFFDLKLKNEHEWNQFVKNWINEKSNNPTALMVCKRKTAYNKVQNYKLANQTPNKYTYKWNTGHKSHYHNN